MPWASDTYSLPAGTSVSPSTTIQSTWANTLTADIQSAFNFTRPIARGGTGATSASAARTNLGLAIGSDVQAYDADTAKLDVAQTWTALQTFGRDDFPSITFDRPGTSAETVSFGIGAGGKLIIRPTGGGGDLEFEQDGALLLDGNPVASVYTGSSAGETDFPVGTVLAVSFTGAFSPDRNEGASVSLSQLDDETYLGLGSGGTGTQLDGLWRQKGKISSQVYLMQRTES